MIENPKIIAAIDIGTNAIRLLIKYADIYRSLPEYKKAAFIRVPIRLRDDVFTKGYIGQTKEKLLSEAMQGFAHLMTSYGVDAYGACATSAMREARNGKDIIRDIKKSSGIEIEIITGNREADLIFKAGEFDSLIDRDKNYVYMDVGGGSTEIVIYSDHRAVSSHSFPLGTVRILSRAVDSRQPALLRDYLETVRRKYRPVAIIGSGGNINKIDKLVKKRDNDPVGLQDMEKLYRRLLPLGFEERMENFGLNSYRADVIIPALELFITAAKSSGVDRIVVPKVGLVDGIIRDVYEGGAQRIPYDRFER